MLRGGHALQVCLSAAGSRTCSQSGDGIHGADHGFVLASILLYPVIAPPISV